MKFKITVLSLLTATFATCLFVAYTLIDKTNKQLELQKIQLEIEIEQYELDHHIMYFGGDPTTEAAQTSAYWRDEINKIYAEK